MAPSISSFCRTLLLQRFVGALDLAFQSLSIHIPRTGLLILLLEEHHGLTPCPGSSPLRQTWHLLKV
ncbi:hypothetical protein WJX84_010759 [Apatococcus fuscideae]|uniref:Uncharacterized protein n=1 Tax=Apatococcus fuscideae TaxID=2026836 RepID=A0AAW1S570_9CHLO